MTEDELHAAEAYWRDPDVLLSIAVDRFLATFDWRRVPQNSANPNVTYDH